MTTNRIVLAGGSGFLGQLLARRLSAQGYEAVVLTRSPSGRDARMKEVHWDGKTLGDWAVLLDDARAVVNLAGRSVNCRYHARNREAILASRVDSTRVLGEAIGRSARPPQVWLNSSTATIYKHSFDRPMDEATGDIAATQEAKDAFSIDVARAWEQAFADARTPSTRKVALRTAMVLSPAAGSVYRVLRRLVRLGLGGRMASGRQFMSWIHEEDFCRAIEWLLEHDDLSGPVNLAAPDPLPNADVMRILRRVCGVPFGLPASRWMLEVGTLFLRTETELIIKSRRVIPARLQASGFQFRFPNLEDAMRDLERRCRSNGLPPDVKCVVGCHE